MCMGGSAPQQPAPVVIPAPPPPPPPPATLTAETVRAAKPTSTQPNSTTKKRNPLRTDSGSPDSVATGLNIPV